MNALKILLPERVIELFFVQSFEKETQWKIITPIGLGSYGKTYLIQNKKTWQQYVLKRLRKRKFTSKESIEAFQKEQEILKHLYPSPFPALMESGKVMDIPFFIMEHIEGKTFEDLIFKDGEVFSEVVSFSMIERILKLIVLIHEKEIVHRDIRIPNVLWDGEKVTIIDFGLACHIEKRTYSKKIVDPKKGSNFISDLYGLGHFLLFLLYTNQSSSKKNTSWEFELNIHPESKKIVKKLLLIDHPYESSKHALDEIIKHRIFLEG